MNIAKKIDYQLVDNDSEVDAVYQSLRSKEILGCDLEAEWNLHRYGLHLCLIQIFDGRICYLIDPQKISNLEPFKELLENAKIQKVWHATAADFQLLDYVLECHPKNIFDIEKAALLLGEEKLSLSNIITTEFGVVDTLNFQRANWNLRPISKDMLNYAAADAWYLLQLKQIYTEKLLHRDRMKWFIEECKLLEDTRYAPSPPELKVKSILTPQELSIFKSLHKIREQMAKNSDMPPFYIFSNQKLLELSKNPPKSIEEWRKHNGLSKKVKKEGDKFIEAINEGLSSAIKLPTDKVKINELDKKRDKQKYFERKDTLFIIKEELKKQYDIASVILSSRNIKKISSGASLNIITKWKLELIKKVANELKINLKFLIDE